MEYTPIALGDRGAPIRPRTGPPAYGIPAEVIDGNDVLIVWDAVLNMALRSPAGGVTWILAIAAVIELIHRDVPLTSEIALAHQCTALRADYCLGGRCRRWRRCALAAGRRRHCRRGRCYGSGTPAGCRRHVDWARGLCAGGRCFASRPHQRDCDLGGIFRGVLGSAVTAGSPHLGTRNSSRSYAGTCSAWQSCAFSLSYSDSNFTPRSLARFLRAKYVRFCSTASTICQAPT